MVSVFPRIFLETFREGANTYVYTYQRYVHVYGKKNMRNIIICVIMGLMRGSFVFNVIIFISINLCVVSAIFRSVRIECGSFFATHQTYFIYTLTLPVDCVEQIFARRHELYHIKCNFCLL